MIDEVLKEGRKTCLVQTSSPAHFRRQLAPASLFERSHPPWADLVSVCLQSGGQLLFRWTIRTHGQAERRVAVPVHSDSPPA